MGQLQKKGSVFRRAGTVAKEKTAKIYYPRQAFAIGGNDVLSYNKDKKEMRS